MGKTGLTAALYFSLVFVGGAVVGGVGYRLYSASAKADSGPSQYRQKYMDEMKGRLSLTPEQTTRIEAILDETRAKYREIYQRNKPEMDAIQADQTRRIHETLSPPQQAEFARLREERDRRRKAASPPR